MRLTTTQELVRVLEENMGIPHVLRKRQGRTGGSRAHPLAAVSYARFVSPEFHAWANQVILERIEERDDAELAVVRAHQRAAAIWRRQGRDEKWIQHRLASIPVRHRFTDTLKAHGITEGVEYAACTNAIYKPLLGGTAKEALIELDLPANANLRDHLEVKELAAVSLSEASAEDLIAEHDLRGQAECESACRASASAIAKALDHAREVIADAKRRRE